MIAGYYANASFYFIFLHLYALDCNCVQLYLSVLELAPFLAEIPLLIEALVLLAFSERGLFLYLADR